MNDERLASSAAASDSVFMMKIPWSVADFHELVQVGVRCH
jgi:hypothetical protein